MTAPSDHTDAVASEALRHLAACYTVNADGAMWAAQYMMERHGAGMPTVALMQETARSDARFWAETASPIELECYMLAATDKLAQNGSLFHGRQIKRLVAALWERMTEEERKGFLLYLQKKHAGQ